MKIPWIDFTHSPIEPYHTNGGVLVFNHHLTQSVKVLAFVEFVQNGKWIEGRDVDGPSGDAFAHIYGHTEVNFLTKTINIITDGERYVNASSQFFRGTNTVVPRLCNDRRIKLNLADREIIRELIASYAR